jgi:hypothetical protein
MIVQEGWGIRIDLSSITADAMKNFINEIIENPK